MRDDEQLRPRRGVGVDRRPDGRQPPPGGARVRDRPLPDPELQVTDRDANLTLKIWRQDGPDAAGPVREPPHRRDQRGVLVPRAARRAQRAADRRGQGRHRLRPRLPRGHLRHVLADDRRPGPRAAAGHGDVPAAHAQVPDGAEIVVEPWRAAAFPIIKDLMVDRAAFDRIVEVGGYITAPTGGAPDANLIPIPKPVADAAMDAAECIGCGACVAACPNGAANLFTGGQDRPPQPAARRARPSAGAHRGDGRADGRALRLVHELRRVRGGLPEVDLDRRHRPDERRLPQVQVQEPQEARPYVASELSAERFRWAAGGGIPPTAPHGHSRLVRRRGCGRRRGGWR